MARFFPNVVSSQLERISQTRDVEIFDEVSYGSRAFPLYVISPKVANPSLPWVCLSAGIHFGEEPAGTLALLEFMMQQEGDSSMRYNILAVPLVNPSSVITKGRENLAGQDINRQFNDGKYCQEVGALKRFFGGRQQRFLFCIDMHEDNFYGMSKDESSGERPDGSYLYENCAPEKSCGRVMLESWKKKGAEVSQLPYIYGDRCDGGLIFNSYQGREPSGWRALDEYMLEHSGHTFTAETPTCWSLERRIWAHKETLRCALNYFIRERDDSLRRGNGTDCNN